MTNLDVVNLATKYSEFRPIWDKLVISYDEIGATKKVVDKIRTFARNNRK